MHAPAKKFGEEEEKEDTEDEEGTEEEEEEEEPANKEPESSRRKKRAAAEGAGAGGAGAGGSRGGEDMTKEQDGQQQQAAEEAAAEEELDPGALEVGDAVALGLPGQEENAVGNKYAAVGTITRLEGKAGSVFFPAGEHQLPDNYLQFWVAKVLDEGLLKEILLAPYKPVFFDKSVESRKVAAVAKLLAAKGTMQSIVNKGIVVSYLCVYKCQQARDIMKRVHAKARERERRLPARMQD